MSHVVVKNLDELYAVLHSLEKPIALWDFFSGELGHETLYVQALGGKFYDDNKASTRVVALCWKGCAILHQNTSDVQIELDDVEVATMDSEAHRGEGRYNWLVSDRDHVEAIDAIPGIMERFGPAYWQNGKRNSLRGRIPTNHYLEQDGYRTEWHGATNYIADRLARTGFRFDAGEPIIARPYLSLFDRNDKLKTFRNTQDWHFQFARELADDNGLELAVLKGWYTRPCPVKAIEFHAKHRDLRTFINVITRAAIHLSPPSGTSELAMVAGCDLAALSYYKEHEALGEKLLRRRGFQYFNYLTDLNCDLADEVRLFVAREMSEPEWGYESEGY